MFNALICKVAGHKPIPYFRTKTTGAFTICLCERCFKWGLFYNEYVNDKGQWDKDLDKFTHGRSAVEWDCLIEND